MSLRDSGFEKLSENFTKEDDLFYRDKLIEQIHNSSREEAKYERLLFLVILAYFLIRNSQINSIQIGPLNFDDLNLALILIPPVFAFLMIKIIALYNFCEAQKRNLKYLTKKIENLDLNGQELKSSQMILTPFSIANIFHYFDDTKPSKFIFLHFILLLPLVLMIPIIALGIEFYWLYELYQNWSLGWLYKTSLIITLWLIFILFSAVPSLVRSSVDDFDSANDEDEN